MKSKDLSWQLYLRKGIGKRLSLLGERLGIHSLIYNPFVMIDFHESGQHNAPKVVHAINQCFTGLAKVLDVGSGAGDFSAEFKKKGISPVALEHSPYGRKLAAKLGVEAHPFDLLKNPPASVSGTFDLAFCFEVAEHLPPAMGVNLIKFICSFDCPIVFTAAHLGQGGTGHINEQPKEYWIEIFSRHSFSVDEGLTSKLSTCFHETGASLWFEKNVLVLKRFEKR